MGEYLRVHVLQPEVEVTQEEQVMELVGDVKQAARALGPQTQALDYVTEVGNSPV